MQDLFVEEVIGEIEQREARLLTWGLTDFRLRQEELEGIIDPLLDTFLERGLVDFLEANEVIVFLLEKRLIFETDSVPYSGFRSRMAETVRLIFRLRQLLPQHQSPDSWQAARTLVADFRFAWRRRKYPNWEVSVTQLLAEIKALTNDKTYVPIISELLSQRGDKFELSGFQTRATIRILDNLISGRTAGTLVSAGTGSGKTLSFYLPVLSRIAALIQKGSLGLMWVKALAIYPRTELLRDQFSEVYSEARRLDHYLTSDKKPVIRIGSYYGGTPYNYESLLRGQHKKSWPRRGNGYLCKVMACPSENCDGELFWEDEELNASPPVEVLTCRQCGNKTQDGGLALTRDSINTHLPDIVFTTTEMLNQRISDEFHRKIFGIRRDFRKCPEVVLLDEVHTYSGVHGAQIGYLLRRWRHLVKKPVSFVGLSATLKDGARFFARLTGMPEHRVAEVGPRKTELVSRGAEYILAVRGDPVSQTSLLSTTIQTAMLLSRMLDAPSVKRSDGFFGSKLFAFTDDIDVINRLYFSLLDAEGRDDRGRPNLNGHPNGGLASLRRVVPSQSREKFGQNWRCPESIGHPLGERKLIGRTTSRDPGVARDMDVIVATASLEVGFNDPAVGAVIQHKSPLETAQFIQRKGRAGRSRKMRPWTVVVLSDYGRDRLAYRNYEKLFDPELDSKSLPFESRYVQRMQAVFSLIDFITIKLSSAGRKGHVWKELSGPVRDKERRRLLVKLLTAILEDCDTEAEFEQHLERSLQISGDSVKNVLWQYPRPVLTSAIPTALRRLVTNWRSKGEDKKDYQIRNSPLPEFVPSNLFSDLNLPEVSILLPPAWVGHDPEEEFMPIVQALRTFAPGRVSRRFGTDYSGIRHWVGPLNSGMGSEILEVDQFFDTMKLGDWTTRIDEEIYSISVLRPIAIKPINPPRPVTDSSNAQVRWHSNFVVHQPGIALFPPTGSSWREMLWFESFEHRNHNELEIRRFTTGSQADIKYRSGDSNRVDFRYSQGVDPIGLGFSIWVDALKFHVKTPDCIWSKLDPHSSIVRALRTKRYYENAWSGRNIAIVESPFVRQWLATIYFSALTFESLINNKSLSLSAEAYATGNSTLPLGDVLETIFQSPNVPQDPNPNPNPGPAGQDRLRQELGGLLSRVDILNELNSLANLLWMPLDDTWENWLQDQFVATFAAAIFNSIQTLCPEIDSDGLVVDLDNSLLDESQSTESDESRYFLVTEKSPGGNGHVEALLDTYTDDPRRFYSLINAALQASEYEVIDRQIGLILEAIVGQKPEAELVNAFDQYRNADNFDSQEESLQRLRHILPGQNFVVFHGFVSALITRILRPGSSQRSDKYIRQLREDWISEEGRLGVEIDNDIFAFAMSHDDAIDQIMLDSGFNLPDTNLTTWRYNAISGLLWSRGGLSRRIDLDLYSPFSQLPSAERLLVNAFVDQSSHRISLEDDDWREMALQELASKGCITLYALSEHRTEIGEAIQFFTTNPIESDYLSVYASIDSIVQEQEFIELSLIVQEVLD